jgi:hypothetical protein
MNLIITTGIVYGGLFIFGFMLSMLSSYLNCRKVSPSISMQEGLVWSMLPTFLYWIANYMDSVRDIFKNVLSSTFGLKDNVDIIAVGYLMMLGSWIMTTRMIHLTESEVCKPSVDELNKFKEDLEKELKKKEDEKEENLHST